MTAPTNQPIDKQQEEKAAHLRTDLWDSRYSPQEIDTLELVAAQYGLDPLTREVMILQGKVYVTAAGLQKLALSNEDYDGCEIDIVEADWDKDFFLIKARVWKKGCSHPFEDYGDADPSTSSLRGHALFRHAITRARARALRSAFAVPFCSLEELDDEKRWEMENRRRFKNGSSYRKAEPAQMENLARNKGKKAAPPKNKGEKASAQEKPPKKTKKEAPEPPPELAATPPANGAVEAPEAQKAPASGSKAAPPQRAPQAPAPPREEAKADPWPPREQEQMAKEVLEHIATAETIDDLKRIWETFQAVRPHLSPELIGRVRDAKDQRKSVLAA
jgi:murein DD-endopeptidase MepM/ murein hydrolase activator NlpD